LATRKIPVASATDDPPNFATIKLTRLSLNVIAS